MGKGMLHQGWKNIPRDFQDTNVFLFFPKTKLGSLAAS
jgi:hypothetical protein